MNRAEHVFDCVRVTHSLYSLTTFGVHLKTFKREWKSDAESKLCFGQRSKTGFFSFIILTLRVPMLPVYTPHAYCIFCTWWRTVYKVCITIVWLPLYEAVGWSCVFVRTCSLYAIHTFAWPLVTLKFATGNLCAIERTANVAVNASAAFIIIIIPLQTTQYIAFNCSRHLRLWIESQSTCWFSNVGKNESLFSLF